MRLGGRSEGLFNADVQLRVAETKPCPASSSERLRLLQFGQPDQRAVAPARLRLATRRRGDLHVIQDGLRSRDTNSTAGPAAWPPPALLLSPDRALKRQPVAT